MPIERPYARRLDRRRQSHGAKYRVTALFLDVLRRNLTFGAGRLYKSSNGRMSSMISRIGLRWCFATLLAVIISVLTANPSLAAESGVLRATLANGLRIVIVRNTLAPVVSTSLNYLVGSDEAPKGFPGMAHAQEHMMFRGSLGLSADQLADIGSMMGGNFNASTTENLTQYLFTVPASDLDVVLHIEALRMANVTDNEQSWNQERGALDQEVAQDVSTPEYVAHYPVRAAMFADTPYKRDALGSRET